MYKIQCVDNKTGRIRHIKSEEDHRKNLIVDSIEEAEEIRDACAYQRGDPPHWLRGNIDASPSRYLDPGDPDYDEEYLSWRENYNTLDPKSTYKIIVEKIKLTEEQINYIGTWLDTYDDKRFGERSESYEWDDNEPFNMEQDYCYLVKHAIKACDGIELTKEQINYIGTNLNIYDEKILSDALKEGGGPPLYDLPTSFPEEIEDLFKNGAFVTPLGYYYQIKNAIAAYNDGDRYTLNSQKELFDIIQSGIFKHNKDHPLYGMELTE